MNSNYDFLLGFSVKGKPKRVVDFYEERRLVKSMELPAPCRKGNKDLELLTICHDIANPRDKASHLTDHPSDATKGEYERDFQRIESEIRFVSDVHSTRLSHNTPRENVSGGAFIVDKDGNYRYLHVQDGEATQSYVIKGFDLVSRLDHTYLSQLESMIEKPLSGNKPFVEAYRSNYGFILAQDTLGWNVYDAAGNELISSKHRLLLKDAVIYAIAGDNVVGKHALHRRTIEEAIRPLQEKKEESAAPRSQLVPAGALI